MPVIDDIKESARSLKGKPFKYKLEYFVQYYGWMTVGIIATVAIVVSVIVTIVTAKDSAFGVLFVNAYNTPDGEAFMEYADIDSDNYEITQDNSNFMNLAPDSYNPNTYSTAQKILAVVAAHSADVMIADESVFEYYLRSELYADLREYFSSETLDALGDKVIWGAPVDYDTGIEGEKYPMAIDVTDTPQIAGNVCYALKPVYFMIIVNGDHLDLVTSYYDFLCTDVK